jgi:acetyl esterase/lipase
MRTGRFKSDSAAAVLLTLLVGPVHAAGAPQVIQLWPHGAPGAAGTSPEKVRLTDTGEHIVSNVHAPSIAAHIPSPDRARGIAVIVIPGGGHVELWMDHEGHNVAEFLKDRGIAAFVLKYRLAGEKGGTYTIEGDSLPDVRRAIRLVRSESAGWHVDPERVGVLGFSAGGQLAALAAAHYDDGAPQAVDPVDRQSARPSFQALLYPAVPAGLAFSPDSPPAFLACGDSDQPGISQGLAELYVAMRRAGAHAELHIYSGVGHGFGLRSSNIGPVSTWPERLVDWLENGVAWPEHHAPSVH